MRIILKQNIAIVIIHLREIRHFLPLDKIFDPARLWKTCQQAIHRSL